ncbi:carboxypeptidase Y inhibitor [Microbotryomycetes sp. JL201]|nr:carboxypeptidase Y inhibitor [Microbotryomycetes sp. JL201]
MNRNALVLLPLQLVRSALDKAGLLGTPYIPRDFHPTVVVQIDFPQTGATVQLGNELEPSQGQGDPVVSFVAQDPSDQQGTFCLVSYDPDAPSRENQEFGPWRHYIAGGLKPKSFDEITSTADRSSERNLASQALVQQTEEPLSPWVAPSPGKGTGLHRYCFALYKQNGGPLKPLSEQSTIKSNERPDRRKFDVATFAKENDLELVGFNYFLCKNV